MTDYFDGEWLRSCERYDPATDAWEPLPSMPTGRSGSGVAMLDGKLWVAGGFNSEGGFGLAGDLATVEVFDPESNTWDQSKADTIHRRWGPAVAVLDGELHAVGGVGDGETSAEKYDPRADSWSAVPGMALPEGWNCGASAVLMI